MKKLILILLTVFSGGAHAGPGTDPVHPWPLNVTELPVVVEDLQGEWVAFDRNTIWFVSFSAKNSNEGKVIVNSQGLRGHTAHGIFRQEYRAFFGKLEINDDIEIPAAIFMDPEGIKLRIYQSESSFYDLQLFRPKPL